MGRPVRLAKERAPYPAAQPAESSNVAVDFGSNDSTYPGTALPLGVNIGYPPAGGPVDQVIKLRTNFAGLANTAGTVGDSFEYAYILHQINDRVFYARDTTGAEGKVQLVNKTPDIAGAGNLLANAQQLGTDYSEASMLAFYPVDAGGGLYNRSEFAVKRLRDNTIVDWNDNNTITGNATLALGGGRRWITTANVLVGGGAGPDTLTTGYPTDGTLVTVDFSDF